MDKTTNAADKAAKPDFNTVELADGRKATMLAPDLNDKQKLCVISESLLSRMKDLLPRVDFSYIKREFIETVMTTRKLEDFVSVIADELDFHNSVRKVTQFFEKEKMTVAEKPEVVAHPTLSEAIAVVAGTDKERADNPTPWVEK